MSANNSSLIITKVSQSKAYPLITLYAKTYSLSFLNSIQQLSWNTCSLKINSVMKFMIHLT